MPVVSVIIPVYNAARWIDHALRSVFAQTYTDFEVIVVDDGSTDAIEDALRPWRDRIVFTRQPNGGPAAARNRGIQLAKGQLIAFLDADDEWRPEKLEMQVAYFERYPEAGLLHTDVVRTDRDRHAQRRAFDPPAHVFCALFHTEFFIPTLTVMVPRRVLAEVGGFDERREIHVEDWDLWLRIAARYTVGYLPEPLARHRPGGMMSTAFEKTFTGQALVIDKQRRLCESACPLHRANPERCMSERRYVLHASHAYERFKHGDRAGARRALAEAIALRPWRLTPYRQYLASFVTEPWLAALRRLRPVGLYRARSNAAAAAANAPAPTERLSLATDTVYRRTRRRVARAAHAIDESVGRMVRRRRRVLFEASSPMSFGLFRSIYQRMSRDPRIEFWFTAPGRAWNPETIFGTVGITTHVIHSSKATWRKWDMCVNTDFFEMANLRRRTKRVHLFHGVAGKYGLDAPVDFAREIASFTCLMFSNQDRMRRYIQAGLVPDDGRTAALVGYPKLDALVDGSLDRAAIAARLRLRPDCPTVLYAPTWSPYSSMNLMGESIIDGLAAAGYQVIVKLHDRSFDRLPRGSGGIDWAKRLEAYAEHPRVRVARDADATPLLFVADAMVTDHSSIGFEFMVLDRPLVIVDCPELLEHSGVNPEKVRQLRAGADVVATAGDVSEAVTAGLRNPGRHSHVRRRTAGEMFYQAGTATDRAVALMYQFLDLEAPVAAEAAHGAGVFAPVSS